MLGTAGQFGLFRGFKPCLVAISAADVAGACECVVEAEQQRIDLVCDLVAEIGAVIERRAADQILFACRGVGITVVLLGEQPDRNQHSEQCG